MSYGSPRSHRVAAGPADVRDRRPHVCAGRHPRAPIPIPVVLRLARCRAAASVTVSQCVPRSRDPPARGSRYASRTGLPPGPGIADAIGRPASPPVRTMVATPDPDRRCRSAGSRPDPRRTPSASVRARSRLPRLAGASAPAIEVCDGPARHGGDPYGRHTKNAAPLAQGQKASSNQILTLHPSTGTERKRALTPRGVRPDGSARYRAPAGAWRRPSRRARHGPPARASTRRG